MTRKDERNNMSKGIKHTVKETRVRGRLKY